jgi:transcriptional regulator with XRE-family HTH domain
MEIMIMDDISIKIGNRVRQLRQGKGISQEELALIAGLNESFIGQIERGKKNATVKTIEKICFALDVTLHEFFSFELDEIDIQSDSILKASKIFKELDDIQLSKLLDIIKMITDFKSPK